MLKHVLTLCASCLLAHTALAGPPAKDLTLPDSLVAQLAAEQAYSDSVNATLHFQQGRVQLPGGIGTLTVPRGFRYLDSAQSRRVLTQIWRNPDGGSLGMLFPADRGPLDGNNWAYVIQYQDMGYVKDDDAEDIDYAELMTDMKQDTEDSNAERTAAGYPAVHLLGWADNPFYDKDRHALHWAKSLSFSGSTDTTLNYNVRLLGRKGVLVLNAVAEPGQIDEIKASIPNLLANVDFARGQQYKDFDADIDEVAAYSIGGLVAGKVLAKVGFFALILKFWKLGMLALAGAWAAIKRFFGFGKAEE